MFDMTRLMRYSVMAATGEAAEAVANETRHDQLVWLDAFVVLRKLGDNPSHGCGASIQSSDLPVCMAANSVVHLGRATTDCLRRVA